MGKDTQDPYCKACGSSNLIYDGTWEWSVRKHKFIPIEVYDGYDPWCEDCEDTTREEWLTKKERKAKKYG